MSISSFVNDDERISKAKSDNPSAGRLATSYLFPGIHGVAAGKKGKRARAAGNEVGGALGGSVAGSMAGKLVARRNPVMGAVAGSYAGGIGGNAAGTTRAHRRGYYRAEA
jgi:hypothetical protein